jgi:fibronectin type 3 domain-containing protein
MYLRKLATCSINYMLLNHQNKKNIARGIFFVHLCVGTILLLAGCGENIPTASVLTSGRVTLSWNDVPGAAFYEIYMSTSPGVTTLNSYKISDVTAPITITDLEPGTTYYFMVTVFSDSGESRKSKEVSYTIVDIEGFIEFGDLIGQAEADDKSLQTTTTRSSSAAGQQSVAPKATPQMQETTRNTSQIVSKKSIPSTNQKSNSAAQSSAAGTRDVTLAWDNVPGATSYNIYWSDKPGVTRRNGTKIGNAKNPHKLHGLVKGKKYYFVVTAVNQSRESSESEEFSFTVGK